MRDIRKFERRGGLSVMKSQNSTSADAAEFEELRKSAKQAYRKGLKLDDLSALKLNKKAYEACTKLEYYTYKYSFELLGKSSSKLLAALKIIISVGVSVAVSMSADYLVNLFLI